jgi:hypothetical protein
LGWTAYNERGGVGIEHDYGYDDKGNLIEIEKGRPVFWIGYEKTV